jgi:hypothetical protein
LREEANLRPELQDSVEPSMHWQQRFFAGTVGRIMEHFCWLWNFNHCWHHMLYFGLLISEAKFWIGVWRSVYGTAVVSPNLVQGELKKQHIAVVDFCFECC